MKHSHHFACESLYFRLLSGTRLFK